MSTRSMYFDAGAFAGRLAGAKHMVPGDLRLSSLEKNLRDSLVELGVIQAGERLPADDELGRHVRNRSGEVESACFEVGADLLMLQMHLKITSLAREQPNFPPELLQAGVDSIKPLVKQLRLRIAQIGAPETVDAFLQRVVHALTDINEWDSASTDLFEESEVIVARVRSLLEMAQSQPVRHSRLSKVFIVHGHDGEVRETVARFISEKLGFEPVILHERPNKGRTIITKFREEASGVGFAIVLMTADDLGKASTAPDLKPRARQNVVFELGFFIGALGSERVAAIVKGDIERPSDFDGVVYISFDQEDWRTKLGQELQAAGYDIDWNRVMHPTKPQR